MLQGKLAAEQRAARDHRDASHAAHQRYQELVSALQTAPDLLPDLLAAHADAGWTVPAIIHQELAGRAPKAADPTPPAPEAGEPSPRRKGHKSQQQHRGVQHADQEPGQAAVPSKAAGSVRQGCGQETEQQKLSGRDAAAEARHREGGEEGEPESAQLKAQVERLSQQLNNQSFEAWEHQKRLQKRMDTLQGKLKVLCPLLSTPTCSCSMCQAPGS